MAAKQLFIDFLKAVWKEYNGTGIIKGIELAISVLCAFFHVNASFYEDHINRIEPLNVFWFHGNILSMMFGGYIIVQTMIVISLATGTPLHKRTDFLFAITGAIAFFAAAMMEFSRYNEGHRHRSEMLIGCLAFINSLVFTVDSCLSKEDQVVVFNVAATQVSPILESLVYQQSSMPVEGIASQENHFSPTAPPTYYETFSPGTKNFKTD